jgi:hypothetical protein
MIDQKRINQLKESVDLVALVKSKGIKIRRNGKGYKGCCPFHEETKPSFSVILHIQELLGHESLESTQIYTKVTINDLKEIHARYHPSENL